MTTLREAILQARDEADGGAVIVYLTCPETHCWAPDCDCAAKHGIKIAAEDPGSFEEIMASLTVN